MRTAFHSSLLDAPQPAPVHSAAWLLPVPAKENDWLAGKSRTIVPLANLIKAVQKAQSILSLPDDWDDAGSPAIRPETLKRAMVLLLLHAAVIWVRFSALMPTPRITPGPEGSVDLHWKTRRRELLINVPQDLQGPATYYGDDFAADSRKGAIPPDSLDLELFAWLTIVD